MMARRALAVWICLAVGGCVTATPRESPHIPSKEFFSKVRVVAQAPMTLPSGLSDEKIQALHATFQQLIAEAVRARGFSVIPYTQTLGTSTRLLRELGGVFDPNTGKVEEEKFRVYREYLRREVRAEFKADAVVSARFVHIRAQYSGSTARWHGASQQIAPSGSILGELVLGRSAGTVPALSLFVWIEDTMSGASIWSALGGVHVLSKRESGQWVPVPVEAALSDAARNRDAVKIAFQSF
jgi:hypothetical protein